jgi:IS4 transposase
VAEGPTFADVRSVVCEVAGDLTMLVTNLNLSPRALFDYYNQRQTIEAFFKADKHVFGMANLRSRRFLSIAAFLWFVMITHNLLVWTKSALFAGTKLAAARTRELVEKVASMPALVVRQGASLRLHVPDVGGPGSAPA